MKFWHRSHLLLLLTLAWAACSQSLSAQLPFQSLCFEGYYGAYLAEGDLVVASAAMNPMMGAGHNQGCWVDWPSGVELTVRVTSPTGRTNELPTSWYEPQYMVTGGTMLGVQGEYGLWAVSVSLSYNAQINYGEGGYSTWVYDTTGDTPFPVPQVSVTPNIGTPFRLQNGIVAAASASPSGEYGWFYWEGCAPDEGSYSCAVDTSTAGPHPVCAWYSYGGQACSVVDVIEPMVSLTPSDPNPVLDQSGVYVTATLTPPAYATLIQWSGDCTVDPGNPPVCSVPTNTVGPKTMAASYAGGPQAPLTLNVQSTPTVSLASVNVAQEEGKPTHFVTRNNNGTVVVTVALSNPNANPNAVTWTPVGVGVQGATNLQRVLNTSTVGDVTLTASTGANSVTVLIHVIAASPLPAANPDADKVPEYAGFQAPIVSTALGEVFVKIGYGGTIAPTYDVSAYLAGARWLFRLNNVHHRYTWGWNNLGDIDLPVYDANFEPVPGMSLVDSIRTAKADLDTSGSIPRGSLIGGPPRTRYWVQWITQEHEQYHVDDFYDNFWRVRMSLFEDVDVESASVFVAFDCTSPETKTAAGAVDLKRQQAWNMQIAQRHGDAYNAFVGPTQIEHEIRDHTVTNPLYVPIYDSIPTIP